MKTKGQIVMEAYEAPKVEVIEVQVEQGFAASIPPIPTYDWPSNNG